MNTTIRAYQDNDLDDLLIAWEKASRLAHHFMSEEFFEKERRNIPTVYLPNADTWVAVVDNKAVGFIALIGNEVGGFFVDPDFQGSGLGRALMDKVQALQNDLVVEVFKENSVGRRFYVRYGFKIIEEKIWEETGNSLLGMAFTPPRPADLGPIQHPLAPVTRCE